MKQKRNYEEARLSVVHLSGKTQLLSGSDETGGGGAPAQASFAPQMGREQYNNGGSLFE